MRSVVLLVFLALLVAPAAWAANPGEVVINEVAWMGSTANPLDEWIELYNNTAQPINLDGWAVLDDVATSYNISAAACVGLDCTIPANGYFLIEKSEPATSVAANLIVGAISLANAGDTLELRDSLGGRIDFLNTGASWYAGDNTNKLTMERRDPARPGDLPANWGNNDGVTINGTDSGGNPIKGTPGQQNSIFGPLPGPEIAHVHCVDETQLMVYFNTAVEQTSAETATSYVLNAGASDINPAGAALDAPDTTLVHLTGISGLSAGGLTNLSTNGIVDAATGLPGDSTARFYAGVVGLAFVRADTAPMNYRPDLLDNTPDAFFTVGGLVSSVKNFSYNEAFLQDAGAGLAIFNQATADALTRGDRIRISGKVAHYRGKDEITDSRFVLLSQGNPIAPVWLTLAELAANLEKYENLLIAVADVSATGGTWPASGADANLNITDDGGTTTNVLRVDRDTDIDGSPEPVWPLDIAGIAGQYTTSDPPNDGYQILPRDLADIGTGCQDADGDGFGTGCRPGPDCDDIDSLIHPGAAERCDGVDNDCDGTRDEDYPDKGQPCDGEDLDLCANGTFVCNAAQDGLDCIEIVSKIEICNGVDDDCDNAVDEEWPNLGDPCDGPDADSCLEGTLICNPSGNGTFCDETGPGHQEECNNQDDDCDGQIDDGFGQYTCGHGVCEVTVDTCVGGQYRECVAGNPTEDSEASCDDGLDNDCDGFADKEDVNCRGQDEGGCGCAAGGHPSSALLALLLGLMAALRYRRRD